MKSREMSPLNHHQTPLKKNHIVGWVLQPENENIPTHNVSSFCCGWPYPITEWLHGGFLKWGYPLGIIHFERWHFPYKLNHPFLETPHSGWITFISSLYVNNIMVIFHSYVKTLENHHNVIDIVMLLTSWCYHTLATNVIIKIVHSYVKITSIWTY